MTNTIKQHKTLTGHNRFRLKYTTQKLYNATTKLYTKNKQKIIKERYTN